MAKPATDKQISAINNLMEYGLCWEEQQSRKFWLKNNKPDIRTASDEIKRLIEFRKKYGYDHTFKGEVKEEFLDSPIWEGYEKGGKKCVSSKRKTTTTTPWKNVSTT